MKILVENEIQQAICRCEPLKVAVAFIGIDWNTFVPDAHRLEAIIVSPTFGSNPGAIVDLVRKIGWDRVYFLDELHAKAYIGKVAAVIGSANLTRNGLSGEGLVELCVEVNGEESIKRVNKVFDELKRRANKQYPTIETKKVRLKELEKNWGAAVANRVIRNDDSQESLFVDFELLGEDHFYVVGYQLVKCEYSENVKIVELLIKDDLHFGSSDEVEKNKWVFVWRMTDSSEPHKTAKPYWFYIHEVFKNGVVYDGCEYSKLAIQRKDLNVPSPPFEITGEVAVAFKKVVQEEDIAKHLVQEDKDIFSLAGSLKGIPSLIRKMKEYMASEANGADDKM